MQYSTNSAHIGLQVKLFLPFLGSQRFHLFAIMSDKFDTMHILQGNRYVDDDEWYGLVVERDGRTQYSRYLEQRLGAWSADGVDDRSGRQRGDS